MGAEGRQGRPVEARARVVFDVGAITRVPGGIASHRATIQVIGPHTTPAAADQRR